MTLGRKHLVVGKVDERSWIKEPALRGSIDHVTVMPVVSAAGIAYNPLVILPGVRSRWRRVADRSIQTPSGLLHPGSEVFMRSVAGTDSRIFELWAGYFIEETEHLRKSGQHLLLILDNHGSHVQARTLVKLKIDNIHVCGLPSHTTHITQPLDEVVFSSFKDSFKQLLHKRFMAGNAKKKKCHLHCMRASMYIVSIIADPEKHKVWFSKERLLGSTN